VSRANPWRANVRNPSPFRPIAVRVASSFKRREIHESIRVRFAIPNAGDTDPELGPSSDHTPTCPPRACVQPAGRLRRLMNRPLVCASRLATQLLLASSRAPDQEADVLARSHQREVRSSNPPPDRPVGVVLAGLSGRSQIQRRMRSALASAASTIENQWRLNMPLAVVPIIGAFRSHESGYRRRGGRSRARSRQKCPGPNSGSNWFAKPADGTALCGSEVRSWADRA